MRSRGTAAIVESAIVYRMIMMHRDPAVHNAHLSFGRARCSPRSVLVSHGPARDTASVRSARQCGGPPEALPHCQCTRQPSRLHASRETGFESQHRDRPLRRAKSGLSVITVGGKQMNHFGGGAEKHPCEAARQCCARPRVTKRWTAALVSAAAAGPSGTSKPLAAGLGTGFGGVV